MMRISIPWVLEVIHGLDGLDRLVANTTALDGFLPLYMAESKIEAIYDQSVYGGYLRASRQAASDLLKEIQGQLNQPDWEKHIFSEWEVAELRTKKNSLKTVLLAELQVAPTYLVQLKDNFDIILLIERGVRLFPPTLLEKVPETGADAAEVGRALAFELSTACGFHTFRVVEAVLKRYWDQVSKDTKRPRLQTIGTYAAALEDNKFGDAKVWEALKQLSKLHRNPLIHPEVILTVEEAIGTIGMARSVLAQMLSALPDAPKTTGAPAQLSAPGENA